VQVGEVRSRFRHPVAMVLLAYEKRLINLRTRRGAATTICFRTHLGVAGCEQSADMGVFSE